MANRAQTNSTGPNWKAHLGELLRGVLSRLRGRIIAGVELDELFRGIRRVRFERLSNEDKVCVAQDTLVADDTFLEEVYTGPGRASVQDSLAVMYVLHEAVHLHQGIGKKAAVRRLRSTGDEQTLMHVDLAADHFAAVATSKALPGRSLPELQAIQIEALRRFPAVAGHSRASVRRKSRRLTSLMGDQMLRLAEGVPPLDGYVYLSFSRDGGSILAFQSGSPVPGIVAEGRLTRREARMLSEASTVRGLNRLAEIRSTLARALLSSGRTACSARR